MMRSQLEQGQIDGGLTKVRASRLRERVNLYLALGGDFEGTGEPK